MLQVRLGMTFYEKDFHPKKPLPTVKPNWTELLAPAEQSRFMWFGHSTLLMRIGNQTIITDPLFGNSASPVPIMMHRFNHLWQKLKNYRL